MGLKKCAAHRNTDPYRNNCS